MPEVLNAHIVGKAIYPDQVYIGRPSKWGNPFAVGKDLTRADAVVKFQNYLMRSNKLLNDLEELRGKDLVCWCSPRQCHGDVLLFLANR